MIIKADQRDYRKAFSKHFHAYTNWKDAGSDISKRLILVYCVECGLKCLLMKQQRINKVEEAQPDIRNELSSHDFHKLLKSLNQAGAYSFPTISTMRGDQVRPATYHQLCRYHICMVGDSQTLIDQYDSQLVKIANWLREQVY